MNGRIRGEETAVRRLAAASLTRFSILPLCPACRERRHTQLDYDDLAEFINPFVLFELINVCVRQAEDTLRMSESERAENLAKLRLDLRKAAEAADQVSKFYE